MIKRYFFGALGVLILIGVICYINSKIVDKYMIQAISYTEEALDLAQQGDMEEACSMALKLHDFWNEKNTYFESVFMHIDVGKITETISSFVSAGLTGDMEDFVREQMLLIEQFSHMSGFEKFRINNIL